MKKILFFALAAAMLAGCSKDDKEKTTYAIGDYYPDPAVVLNADKTVKSGTAPIGIVFYLSNPDADGKSAHGKILDLREAPSKRMWGPNDGTVPGATDSNNGLFNMRIIKAVKSDFSTHPAFAYVDQLNAVPSNYPDNVKGVWYLPAVNELLAVYDWWNANQTGNNAKLENAGGTKITVAYYQSSTEYETHYAWSIHTSDGDTASRGKETTDSYVRAISIF